MAKTDIQSEATPAPTGADAIAALAMPEGEDAERWQRWLNFLAKARAVNPVRFDDQLAKGEFNTIASTFERVQF